MLKTYLSVLACDPECSTGDEAFTALCLLELGVAPRDALRAAHLATSVQGDSHEFSAAAYYGQAAASQAVL